VNYFIRNSFRILVSGSTVYRLWLVFLLVLIAVGTLTYVEQYREGLIVTALRDQVTWGFYIGNFTFLVGVAAAAIMLVIPAYVYNWKPIKEIVILGELLAISAIIMCMLFVSVDIGRIDRFWHLIPVLGNLNFPLSLMAWDVIVLNLYLFLNVFIVSYLLYAQYHNREYPKKLLIPLILFSIPVAIGIHTVTAFLYNGMVARPFWNASILAPKFLASAFCSGPAILLILLQILRRHTRLEVKDEAIWKIAELMAYAMFINLFLIGAEIFKEYYSGSHHLLFTEYLYSGIGEHNAIVGYAWLAMFCNIVSFLLFLVPATRRNPVTLNIGAVLIYTGIYVDKGIGLIIPGLTPDTLGEIYEYTPTTSEVLISAGIFAVGFLVFTLLVKLAVPIMLGDFNAPSSASTEEVAPATA